MHYPESRFYIRRVRLDSSIQADMIQSLVEAGYEVEPDVVNPDSGMVVSFPVDVGEGVRTLNELSMWEQLSLASFLQRYWADNQGWLNF